MSLYIDMFAQDNDEPVVRSASHYYHQRRRRRAERPPEAGSVPTFESIIHHENLIAAYYELQRSAGRAPGPDGLTYALLSPGEVAANMRDLSNILANGMYRPNGCRVVPIPKSDGSGSRELRLRGIYDRVVSRVLQKALTPLWESKFLPRSMGFRPDRSAHRMLAEIELLMATRDCWVLTVDDVLKAFDNINVDDLMDDHRRNITDSRLLLLIEVVLRGGDANHKIGNDQGSPYSPMALNVRLDQALDRPYSRNPANPVMYRYADNIAIIGKDVAEATQGMDHARHLLEAAGLTLKGKDGPPADLKAGETCQLLGFTLFCKDGHLGFDLAENAWKKLEHDLKEVHWADNPPAMAKCVMAGWIRYFGPTFTSLRADTQDRLLQTLAQHGFWECFSQLTLWSLWSEAWKGWCKRRKAFHQFLQSQESSPGTAAPPAFTTPGVPCTPEAGAPAAAGASALFTF
ncbi:MAG: hypothetical protein FJ271_30355 [Planctomycetes bacterium]|nr:hypothetical protein [Planctomycetota bacterium]